jgi:hypothetical protein
MLMDAAEDRGRMMFAKMAAGDQPKCRAGVQSGTPRSSSGTSQAGASEPGLK